MATTNATVILQAIRGIQIWEIDLPTGEYNVAAAGTFWWYDNLLYFTEDGDDGEGGAPSENDNFESNVSEIDLEYGANGTSDWHNSFDDFSDNFLRVRVGSGAWTVIQLHDIARVPVRKWQEGVRSHYDRYWLYNHDLYYSLHFDDGNNGAPPENDNFKFIVTGDQIVSLISELEGDDRLSLDALKDADNIAGVGGSIAIQGDGVEIEAEAAVLNFIGDGVTVTAGEDGEVEIAISDEGTTYTGGDGINISGTDVVSVDDDYIQGLAESAVVWLSHFSLGYVAHDALNLTDPTNHEWTSEEGTGNAATFKIRPSNANRGIMASMEEGALIQVRAVGGGECGWHVHDYGSPSRSGFDISVSIRRRMG